LRREPTRATIITMRLRRPYTLIPAGEYLPRQTAPGLGLAGRVGIGAALVAVLAAFAAAAALLLWLVSVLLPIALGAAVVAYCAFRLQFGAHAGRPGALAPYGPRRGPAGA
jgi:hypothetical protein